MQRIVRFFATSVCYMQPTLRSWVQSYKLLANGTNLPVKMF